MELSPQALNRTLLDRQHLLSRTSSSVPAMVEHLVGLQAQDNLPPYFGLAARLEGFDPYDVTRGLEDARWSASSRCGAPCTCWSPTTP